MYILKYGFAFEWDPQKALTNAAKHGVTFDEACTVFFDVHGLDLADQRHSDAETRFRRLGRSADERVLGIVYTVRSSIDGKAIRIINARQASRRERAAYSSQN